MLRMYCQQQWYGLEDALYDSQALRDFVGIDLSRVDATIIAAPSSTKNDKGERDPEMHQTQKGNQWHFGMKAHIGVDAESGLVPGVIGTAANVNDVTQAGALLHGQEKAAFGDAGYRGVQKLDEAKGPTWHVAMQPGKRRRLDLNHAWARKLEEIEQLKASVRAKVEHPFIAKRPLLALQGRGAS